MPTADHSDDIPARAASYAKFREARRNHPGHLAYLRWMELRRAYEILLRNANDLSGLLQAFESDEHLIVQVLSGDPDSDGRNEFYGRLDQHIHNLAASRSMLVDITRRHLKKYADTPFQREFNRRKNVLAGIPSAIFLQDLRNYLLHFGLSPYVVQVHIADSDSKAEADVKLDCDALLEWDKWTAIPRKLIQESRPHIDLKSTVSQVILEFQSLYTWTLAQFDSLHGAEVDEVNNLIRENNLALSGGRWEEPGKAPERFPSP